MVSRGIYLISDATSLRLKTFPEPIADSKSITGIFEVITLGLESQDCINEAINTETKKIDVSLEELRTFKEEIIRIEETLS